MQYFDRQDFRIVIIQFNLIVVIIIIIQIIPCVCKVVKKRHKTPSFASVPARSLVVNVNLLLVVVGLQLTIMMPALFVKT